MTEVVSHSAVAPEEGSCTLERWHYTYCVTSHLRGESSTWFIRTKEDFLPPPLHSIKYVFVAECCCYSITNRWISSAPEELLVSWENTGSLCDRLSVAVCPPGRHRGPPASHSHGTLGDNLRCIISRHTSMLYCSEISSIWHDCFSNNCRWPKGV